MENSDGLSRLLYMFLQLIKFKRLRLYVLDRQEHIAVLKCAVDIDNKDKNMALSSQYGGMYKIKGINLSKLYNHGIEYEPDLRNYADFIARFKMEPSFNIYLDQLNSDTIPSPVMEFHRYHNIKSIGVISLWENVLGEKNFIGYMALDKGSELLTLEDLRLLNENIDLISNSILTHLNNQEAEWQQRALIQRSDELIKRMKKNQYEIDDLVSYLFDAIFDICKGSDIVQVKQVIPAEVLGEYKCIYLYVKNNPAAKDITSEQFEYLKSLENHVRTLNKDDDWVTLKVFENKSAMYIPNMRRSGQSNVFDKAQEINYNNFIRRRNNSEINIPFRIDDDVSGIIDVHGRRPYSLNENSLHILRDIALWFGILLSEKEKCKQEKCNSLSDAANSIKTPIQELNKINFVNGFSGEIDSINYYDLRGAILDIKLNVDQYNYKTKYYDNRAMVMINNYISNIAIYSDSVARYKNTKKITKYALLASCVALPLAFISQINIFIHFLPICGIITSICVHKMASVGLKEYNIAYSEEQKRHIRELPDFLKVLSSTKDIMSRK